MGGLPRLARLYIVTLALAVFVSGLLSFHYLPSDLNGLLAIGLFTAAACAAHLFPITLPRVRAEFFISTAINMAVAILFGPVAALWSSFVSAAIGKSLLRRPWPRIIFNASQLSLTYGIAAVAYEAIWDGQPLENFWPALPAVIALGGVYFMVNTGLVFLIVSLVDRTPFLRAWQQGARSIMIHDFLMVAVGLVFSILWTYNRWSIPLIVPLVLLIYQSLSAVGKMEQQTKEALLALARVIDQRDCQTFTHSERVAEYVVWICEEMGLPTDQSEEVIYAARLHDLGKVGVPDGLLLKPGKLTSEEEAQFRRHPDVGADILAQFPIFREGTDIVRHEHEWYNGEGYPKGLRGAAIPLGSRIIAVADAYEAMMSDRPYRKALGQEIAIDQLLRGRGTQFDPIAIDAFLAVLERRQKAAAPVKVTLEPARVSAGSLAPIAAEMPSADIGPQTMQA